MEIVNRVGKFGPYFLSPGTLEETGPVDALE